VIIKKTKSEEPGLLAQKNQPTLAQKVIFPLWQKQDFVFSNSSSRCTGKDPQH